MDMRIDESGAKVGVIRRLRSELDRADVAISEGDFTGSNGACDNVDDISI
jgi:hypothetical protein